MSRSIYIIVFLFISSLLSNAQDPNIWISLNPSNEVQYWLVYREETYSKLYEPANGTIIPMAIYKINSKRLVSWGISPLILKDEQVKFDFLFKSSIAKEGRLTHNFFSKGGSINIVPTVHCSEDCFRIQIPEEHGKVRNIVIKKEPDIASFKKKYRVSPLMPIFTWEGLTVFEM
jgi:hypothetical protein